MSSVFTRAPFLLLALGLAGCGSASVSSIMGDDAPSVQAARANADLSMPPDLRLHPPSEAAAYAAPAATTPEATSTTSAALSTAPGTAAAGSPAADRAQIGDDIFAKYGISKTNPDGTAKTPQQMQNELRAAMIAQKRQTNPAYGTIFNIGDIFKDP